MPPYNHFPPAKRSVRQKIGVGLQNIGKTVKQTAKRVANRVLPTRYKFQGGKSTTKSKKTSTTKAKKTKKTSTTKVKKTSTTKAKKTSKPKAKK